jgi:hypothetical protein
MFQEAVPLQRTTPSKTSGVEIELPDFDEMFHRIQAVSPLAKLAVNGGGAGLGGGFGAIDDTSKFRICRIDIIICCCIRDEQDLTCLVVFVSCIMFYSTRGI